MIFPEADFSTKRNGTFLQNREKITKIFYPAYPEKRWWIKYELEI
jgi:hypothetical protein